MLAVFISDINTSLPSKVLVTRHSYMILTSDVFAAEILASRVIPKKDGTDIEASIANTATTTTSSNKEKPF